MRSFRESKKRIRSFEYASFDERSTRIVVFIPEGNLRFVSQAHPMNSQA